MTTLSDHIPLAKALAKKNKSHVSEEAGDSKPLDKEEQKVYEAVRDYVKGISGFMSEKLLHENILRVVRGYRFEKLKWQEVACKEMKKIIEWRKKDDVDAATLLTREFPKGQIFVDSWKTGVFGVDKQGHPLLVDRLQDINVDSLLAHFDHSDMGIYQARNVEYLQLVKAELSDNLGKIIYKHCYIMDLAGLSRKHFSVKGYLSEIFHVGQYYYPETLYKMFLINVPFLFRAIWKLLTPLIHPITREKIKLLGHEYLKELEQNGITSDQIPPTIKGGTFTLPDVSEQGSETASEGKGKEEEKLFTPKEEKELKEEKEKEGSASIII